jgi:hypothetical protein
MTVKFTISSRKQASRRCRKTVFILYVLAVCQLLTAGISYAAFLDPGWGARATAMGGAYTALADDSSGIFWNPAGTARSDEIQLSLMYAQPLLGLDLHAGHDDTSLGMNYGSFMYPLSWGTLGLAVSNLSASGIYSENVYALNYSVSGGKISAFAEKFKPKSGFGGLGSLDGRKRTRKDKVKPETYWGMNIKMLGHGFTKDRYTESDPVFESGDSKSALSLDLGMLLLYKKLLFGMYLRDLNQPDVGLDSEDKVPMEIRTGVGFNLGRFISAVDFSSRDKLINMHAGCEYRIKALALRAGFNLDEVTAGFGLKKGIIKMDYSFIWPLSIKESYGTHRISLTFKLGQKKKEEKDEGAVEKEYKKPAPPVKKKAPKKPKKKKPSKRKKKKSFF